MVVRLVALLLSGVRYDLYVVLFVAMLGRAGVVRAVAVVAVVAVGAGTGAENGVCAARVAIVLALAGWSQREAVCLPSPASALHPPPPAALFAVVARPAEVAVGKVGGAVVEAAMLAVPFPPHCTALVRHCSCLRT